MPHMPDPRNIRPRVLYLGMPNGLSRAALETLIASAVTIVAVLLPADEAIGAQTNKSIQQIYPDRLTSPLPMINPYVKRDLRHVAWENSIPVYEVRRIADPGILETLRHLDIDVACVSCFPKRIPGPILSHPPFGFLNLHPSLLPAYRGPTPLFWIFRNGDQADTGITVHYVDEELDAGDIVFQESISFPDGISGSEADEVCGRRGGQLLAKALESIATGDLTPVPQRGEGSYFQSPAARDFELNTSWPARRAFNFMRGTAEWGRPYPLNAGGRRFRLTHAENYTLEETLTHSVVQTGDVLRIRFSPGALIARGEQTV
jgi:methionyl-tRNA formyltransferase